MNGQLECCATNSLIEHATETRLHGLIASRKLNSPLERPFYTDPAIFKIDLERIFMHRWLFVGHISQIPKPGDYFTYEIGNESLVVIRGKDATIHALFNVCRHRGSRICLERAGHVNSLVCPYHQWVYQTDGTLAAARLMPKDFDKSQYSLHLAHVRVLEGMIFVSLSDHPPDFSGIEQDVRPGLAPYDLANAKVCVTKQYNVHSNWKLIAENLRECYHCAANHPEYCNTVIGASTLDSPKATAEFDAYLKECQEKWKAMGLPDVDNRPVRKETAQARYPLRKGYQSESLDGRPLAPLMGSFTERDGGVYGMVIIPNFYMEANCDYAYTSRMTPVSTTMTHFEIAWYVRKDAREGVDYDVDQITKVADATWSQDFRLCEINQLGVNSVKYEPGPYAPAELLSFEYGSVEVVGVCEQVIQWYLSDLQGNY
jgi:glycine betaine catabolism A